MVKNFRGVSPEILDLHYKIDAVRAVSHWRECSQRVLAASELYLRIVYSHWREREYTRCEYSRHSPWKWRVARV